MSEILENVSEQNSAQSDGAATAQSANAMKAVAKNDVEAVPVQNKAGFSVTNAIKNTNDECLSKLAGEELSTSPTVDTKKTPVKRTPSKRISYIERAQKESEELVKNMGGSLEMEGGRRTRSSTRGTPTRLTVASTPPPAKKARSSPASGASTPTTPRARGRKIETSADAADEEEEILPTPTKIKATVKGEKNTADEEKDIHKKSEDPKETQSNDTKKSLNEDKTDSTEFKAGESKEKSKIVKVSLEVKEAEKKEQSEIDAILEPVSEETLSQVVATETYVTKEPETTIFVTAQVGDNAPNATKSIKSNSPMETDELKQVESVTERKAVKEPTPEPMEVDSSSKSSDVIEEMEPEVNAAHHEPQSSLYATSLNIVEKVEKKCQQNSVESTIVPNNSIEAKTVAIETVTPATAVTNAIENSTKESTTPADNGSNKSENNLCEPKIAKSLSISTSNDNSVTTPQTCN